MPVVPGTTVEVVFQSFTGSFPDPLLRSSGREAEAGFGECREFQFRRVVCGSSRSEWRLPETAVGDAEAGESNASFAGTEARGATPFVPGGT